MEIGIIFISLDIALPNHQFPRRKLYESIEKDVRRVHHLVRLRKVNHL